MQELQAAFTNEEIRVDKALNDIEEGLSNGRGLQAARGIGKLEFCNNQHRELLADMFERNQELPRLYSCFFQQTRFIDTEGKTSTELRTALQAGETAAVVARLKMPAELSSDNLVALIRFLEELDTLPGKWPYRFVQRRRGRRCDIFRKKSERAQIYRIFQKQRASGVLAKVVRRLRQSGKRRCWPPSA